MDKDIISIKQLPVISEQLHKVKAEIEKATGNALKLAVTAETVTAVKNVRADLNKKFNELEGRRKAVKNAIMEPYNAFEDIYKECVSEPISSAVKELGERIKTVEDNLLQDKRLEVEAYFDELADMHNLDFIKWEDCSVKVTKSASMKSLKSTVLNFINDILDKIKIIEANEYADEVMYLFKNRKGGFYLNASEALCFVTEKNRATKAPEKVREPMDTHIPAQTSDAPLSAPVKVEKGYTKPVRVTITVTGTTEDLRKLKKFLTEGAYKVEYR